MAAVVKRLLTASFNSNLFYNIPRSLQTTAVCCKNKYGHPDPPGADGSLWPKEADFKKPRTHPIFPFPEKSRFPNFALHGRYSPIAPFAGTGSVYETKIKRKRELKDPNEPNFVHIESLNWTNWRLLRDVRRRYVYCAYHPNRTFSRQIYRNTLLPNLIRVRKEMIAHFLTFTII